MRDCRPENGCTLAKRIGLGIRVLRIDHGNSKGLIVDNDDQAFTVLETPSVEANY